jgi:hypothetical protein
MASVIDLGLTDVEDLFRSLDLDSMLKLQRKMLSGGNNPEYPSTLLINSEKITVGVNFGARVVAGTFSGILAGDRSCPQDGPLFDWGFPEEPIE